MAQMGRPFMRLSAWNSVENIACPGNAVFHGVQHGVLRLAKRHVQKLAFLRAEFAQHVPYHFPLATGLADAEIQLISGHAKRETLAIYQHIALDEELEKKYHDSMKNVDF